MSVITSERFNEFPRVIINCDSVPREMSIVFVNTMCQMDVDVECAADGGDIVSRTLTEIAFVVIMSFAGHLID